MSAEVRNWPEEGSGKEKGAAKPAMLGGGKRYVGQLSWMYGG